MKIVLFSFRYLSKERIKLVIYVLASIILALIGIFLPYESSRFIDILTKNEAKVELVYVVNVIVCGGIIQIALSYVKNIVLTELQAKAMYSMEREIIQHVSGLPLSFFRKHNSTYLNDRILSDIKIVLSFTLGNLLSAVLNIFTTALIMIAICGINSVVFSLLLSITFIFYVLYLMFRKEMYFTKRTLEESKSMYYAISNKLFLNIESIKIHEWHKEYLENFDDIFCQFYKRLIKNSVVCYLFVNMGSVLRCVFNAIIFIYCGELVYLREMTLGEFTIINSYSFMIISNLESLLSFSRFYQNVCVSFDRINEVFAEKKEINGNIVASKINSIFVDNLSFGYETKIIKNLSISLSRGSIYCIVGANGSGKSTLIKILCGLEQNYTGSILINGIDQKSINLNDFRRNRIAVVEQRPSLLYYKKNMLKRNIEEKENKMLLDVDSIVLKYKNRADNSHSTLSGGEIQKLAIVEAIMKDVDVLIMDEPGASLDIEGLNALIDLLENERNEKIVVVITHQKEIIEISDYVLDMSTLESKKTNLL